MSRRKPIKAENIIIKILLFTLALSIFQYISIGSVDAADNGANIETNNPDEMSYVAIEKQSLTDAEQAFALYVENELAKEVQIVSHSNGGRISMKQSVAKRGDKLAGLNKYVYDYMEEYIIDVAAGKKWNTVVTIDLSGIISLKYTAKDLGIKQITSGKGISEEARKAVGKKINYNMELIEDALLADHPYELYWFDKTKSIPSNWYKNGVLAIPISLGQNRYGEDIIEIDEQIELSLPVVKEYAKSQYCVERATGQGVQKAISNAKKIRDRYADKTDEEKLTGYCNEICKLTSYNRNPGKDYGNPWQIIWVFDNNNLSKVQCEGYSKAFQYLCDISTFSDKISCITVTGSLTAGGTKRNHMWNIVTMQDGKKYLADITNCDGNTYYFLAGCQKGTVIGGYIYRLKNMDYMYSYDKSTLSMYTKAELTMSSSWYLTPARKKAKAERIYISGISHRIAAGKKIKLKASIEPAYTSNKRVRWKSSNKKIAKVSQDGKVTIKKGTGGRTVYITATAQDGSNKKRSWKIRVMKGSVKSIKIKAARKKIKAGKKMRLKAAVKASRQANKKLLWVSSNDAYASVTQTGIVTAKKAGKAHTVTITAKATDGSGRKKTIKLKIK